MRVDSFVIFENDVFICCCNYLPSPVGSVRAGTLSELWNSPTAQDIRGAVLDGSFQYCNKMLCPHLRNRALPLRTDDSLEAYYKNIIAQRATSSPMCHPRSIELNEDPVCNLTCPSCRGGKMIGNQKFLTEFENNILPSLFENPVNLVLIACFGEVFASRHYLRILRSLDPVRNPISELVLYTNGLLLTREQWEGLSNLRGYSIEIRVSIDAVNPETYSRIRRGGDWQTLLANLAFISGLRSGSEIAKLKFMFVVQDGNFREMPAFVEMARHHQADEVVFFEIQKYGEYFTNDAAYAERAVHLECHPNHVEYQGVVRSLPHEDGMISFLGTRVW